MGLFNGFRKKNTEICKCFEGKEKKVNDLRKNKEYRKISIESKMKLEKYTDELKEKGKISAYIPENSKEEVTIFSSKYGGTPYWDLTKEYPTDFHGDKLIFLTQINFDKENIDDSILPAKGMLQFFIANDDTYGLDVENPNIQKSWKVIYHSEVNYDIKEEDIIKLGLPRELDILDKESSFKLKEVDDMIQNRIYNYEDVEKEIIKEELNEDEREYLNECMSLINSPSDKILGYPLFWQDDPRNDKKYEDYNTLLLQYSTCTDIVFFFFINRENLKNGDFSNILFWTDC